MKKGKITRINLLMAAILFGAAFVVNAQGEKLSREEKKEAKKAQLNENFRLLDTLLTNRMYVLEADYLENKYGGIVPVTSQLNFISVKGDRGVLQTGSNSGFGYNGVGGVTAEGSVGSYEISKDFKKMLYKVRFNINSQIGNYDVFMFVSADNNATASISGIGPGKLTWRGHLKFPGNSRVFKGQNTY